MATKFLNVKIKEEWLIKAKMKAASNSMNLREYIQSLIEEDTKGFIMYKDQTKLDDYKL